MPLKFGDLKSFQRSYCFQNSLTQLAKDSTFYYFNKPILFNRIVALVLIKFCFLDPSIISLPSSSCTMQQFVDSIFYIGKGIRSRPFRHLVDAVRAKSFGAGVLSVTEIIK